MFDRDRIIDGVDLALLADELLGPRKGPQRSGSWPCPDAQHAQTGRTPPVSVFSTHRGEQRWRCHGCGAGGTAIDLVMRCTHVDVREALADLARRAGSPKLSERGRSERRRRTAPPPFASPESVAALDAYVRRCTERLWRPGGRSVLRWLTQERGLSEELLRANLVGADPGPRREQRPDGVPRVSGAVFPAVEDGRAVFVQLRRLPPNGEPRWLSAAGRLVPNPKLAIYQPAAPIRRAPVIVTEGPIDALSACEAGFRSVAVLGAQAADTAVAARLSALRGGLVLAFDEDEAGRTGASALAARLRSSGCPVATLHLPDGVSDLNEWAQADPQWRSRFRCAVEKSVSHPTVRRSLEMGGP